MISEVDTSSNDDYEGRSVAGFEDDFEVEIEEDNAGQAAQDDTDTVVMKKADLLALQNQGGGQLEKLADLIASRQQAPINQQPVQQYGETDEQFEARIHEELFTAGKTKKVLEEVISRATAPLVQRYENTIAQLSKQVALNSGQFNDVMGDYGTEVDALLGTLTPAQRANPDAVSWAVNQVKAKHVDDIVAKQVAKKLAEAQTQQAPQRGSGAFQRGAVQQAPVKAKVKASEYNALYQRGMDMFGSEEQAAKYANSKLRRRG